MFLGKTATPSQYLYVATVLTAGTALLLWLGDQITQKGIGNGLSLIIMAGIIATLPQMFIDAFQGLVVLEGTTQAIAFGIVKFLLFVIVYFAIHILIWLPPCQSGRAGLRGPLGETLPTAAQTIRNKRRNSTKGCPEKKCQIHPAELFPPPPDPACT